MRQPYSVIGAFGGNWLQWRRKRPEPPKWHPPCKHLPCRTTANSAGAQLLQLGWYVAHKAYLEACLALDLVLVSSAGNSTCAFNISFGCLSSKYSLHSKELSLPCCLFSWFGWGFFFFFPPPSLGASNILLMSVDPCNPLLKTLSIFFHPSVITLWRF